MTRQRLRYRSVLASFTALLWSFGCADPPVAYVTGTVDERTRLPVTGGCMRDGDFAECGR